MGILTYNDAGLSGQPKIARFQCNGAFYYVKVYPVASATTSESDDDPASDLYLIDDVAIGGRPVVFGLLSDSVEYYFKGYPILDSPVPFDGDTDFLLTAYRDASLFGSPRIAQALVGETEWYWKVYPDKILNDFIPHAIESYVYAGADQTFLYMDVVQSYVYADAWDDTRGIVVVESTVYQDGA
jgi:hypothetical protein